ncbi:hypothetical protein HC928_22135 [bacterium]|nr:hypothetical protein [bacterium]
MLKREENTPQLSRAEMHARLGQAIEALEDLEQLDLVFQHILQQFPTDSGEFALSARIEVIHWLIESAAADVSCHCQEAIAWTRLVWKSLSQEKPAA